MNALDIIKKPLVTEKTAKLQPKGVYVFVVAPTATKNEIKKALKSHYRVDAIKIQTLRERPIARSFRGRPTMKQGMKKAFVTLKKGQTIDIA